LHFQEYFEEKIIEFDNENLYFQKNGSVEKYSKLKTEKFTMKKMVKIGKNFNFNYYNQNLKN
jgi:hypothetical protein